MRQKTLSGQCLFFIAATAFLLLNTMAKETEPVSEDKAMDYLVNYAYVEPGKLQEAGGQEEKGNLLEKAIKAFQEMAHLPTTGKLDIKTKKKMAQPRCGMQDAQMIVGPGGGPRWKKDVVTFKFTNFSPQLSSSRIRAAVQKAYDTWSQQIPIRFKETSGQADINIQFAARSHGDPWPFDGRSGVLAHATMPTDGKLHFDEDEKWAIGPEDVQKIANSYTDLYPVAIHEIGHTLGLEHSKVENAIMAPFYQESVDESGRYIPQNLKPDDIRAIKALYGSGGGGGGSSSSAGRAPPRGGGTSSSGGGRTSGFGGSSGSGFGSSGFGSSGFGSSGFGSSGGFGGSRGRSGSGSIFGDDWGSSFGSGGGTQGSGSRTTSWSSPDGRSRGSVTTSHSSSGSGSGSGSSRGKSGGFDLDSLFNKWLGRRR